MTEQPGKLRSLLGKISETLLAKIVVGIIVLSISLEVLTGFVTDYIFHPILTALQLIGRLLQSEVEVWHLLVMIIGGYVLMRVVSYRTTQPHPPSPKKPSYYFIDRGGYKWKVLRYNGEVYRTPFCREHQVMLSYRYLECPICQRKNTNAIDEYNINKLHDEVSRLAAAQVEGHLKD